jgi:hypothetical protein
MSEGCTQELLFKDQEDKYSCWAAEVGGLEFELSTKVSVLCEEEKGSSSSNKAG